MNREVRVLAAGGAERRVPLQGTAVIGRAEDSDIYLSDELLSRRHAAFELRAEGCFLVDFESTNGTYLNGERLQGARLLADGDVVEVGATTMVFRENADGGRPSAATPGLLDHATRTVIDVNELVKRDRVLSVLSRITSALTGHTSLPELYPRILDLVLEVIPAERGAILLLEGTPPQPVTKATRDRSGMPVAQISGSIVSEVISAGVALLLNDVYDRPSLRERPSIVLGSIRAAMCAPLWLPDARGQGAALGVIYLDSSVLSPFGDADLHVLTVLANFAATRIDAARIAEENLEKRRIEQDLRLAAEIQAQVMLEVSPTVPGYDIAGISRPSYAVGGDYYDLVFDGERLHFALGDVSGKGVGAAMLMAALRATVRAYWRDGALASAVTRVNLRFLENVPIDRFATCVLGRIETASGRVAYVNAGHERPLLLRARGGVESLAVGGTILGAFPDVSFREGAAVLEPGDTLLLFSDGVSETWPDAEAAEEGLVALVRQHARQGAQAVENAIMEDLERRQPGRGADDRTLLVIQRLSRAS